LSETSTAAAGWVAGQVAVITGGGSGLGREIVRTFVTEGARVVVLERSDGKCHELAAAFPDDLVAVVQGDVASPQANAEAVAVAQQRFGGLDTFIANAGLWDFMRSIDGMSGDELEQSFDEVFRVNVLGPMMGANAALDALRESRGAFLVTLSNAALFPGGGGPLYVASKHAGVGFVKQLAADVAPLVRVNGIAPGGMPTDLRGPASLGLDGTPFDSLPVQEIMEQGPLRRCPAPGDYVGAYLLLASRTYGLTASGTVMDVCNAVGLSGAVTMR
jgi:NAD(P)-dependent dehydrogenase (short-subunit alcohol dehydrogenase family)